MLQVIVLNTLVKHFKKKQKNLAQTGNNCYYLNCGW